eukprot:6037230-Prymnesium_polylepis.1
MGAIKGVPITNFNNLTGPKGAVPESYEGHVSFPDPEVTSTPRLRMKAIAIVSHIAKLLGKR